MSLNAATPFAAASSTTASSDQRDQDVSVDEDHRLRRMRGLSCCLLGDCGMERRHRRDDRRVWSEQLLLRSRQSAVDDEERGILALQTQ